MTEEFKSTLFSYLIGRLPKENGTTEEIFKEINDLPRDNWINVLPSGYNNFKYEGIIQAQTSDLLVLYGGYKTTDNEVKGIITIVDNEFNPITSIYQYDSGTYLRYIQCMKQDEDGTFYAIDCPDFPGDKVWSFTTSQKRFLMFNNFTQQANNSYLLTLQKSYIFPTDYFNFYCRKLFKDTESSHYVMVGNYLNNTSQSTIEFTGIRLIELKVNVGSENEWNKIDDDGQGWLLGDSYVDFKDDNYYFRAILNDTASSSRELYLWTKDYSQSSPTLKSFKTFEFQPYVDSSYYHNQSVFINKNELYFVQNNQLWGKTGSPNAKYIGLYYYNDETTEFKTIYEKSLGNYVFCNLEAIYITQNNNDIYIEFNGNVNSESDLADYHCQRLVNFEWSPILISEQQYFVFDQRALYVSNNFNLLKIIMYPANPRRATWKLYNIKENYNSSKYNGEPYINTNALISDNAEIYSNNSLVFARNLYNKTLNNGTTTSTVEIPNNYLNDIDLTSKLLLSKTNLTLINDEDMIQKNEYETVFLNFINSIVIADRNNATQVLNQEASTYLNNAINTDDSYDNAKFYDKVIINYQDGSIKEVSYGFENYAETSTTIVFGLYVDKLINNAQIVSNDKTITYQTIDLSNLELNKNYSIKQKLEVV